MTKETRIYNGKKIISSISVLGKLDSYMQKNAIRTFSNTTHKNKLECIKDLNVRPDTIKLLEGNKGRTLVDINCNNSFFDPSPRVTEIKINKLYLIKLKNFGQQRKP